MLTKKKKQINERLLILENCDRGTILEVAKILLRVVSEVEQYFKECEDISFIIKHPEGLTKRRMRIAGMLLGLHNMFKD